MASETIIQTSCGETIINTISKTANTSLAYKDLFRYVEGIIYNSNRFSILIILFAQSLF